MLTSAVLAVGTIGAFWLFGSRDLPRCRLSDGAEFRVLQITYTPDPSETWEHNLNGPPRWKISLWRALPSALQKRIPFPDTGIDGYGFYRSGLSIWWARFDPLHHLPELGPSGDVWMTLDNGERINLHWPKPADEYRVILIADPPPSSRRLSFEVPAYDEDVVHFTIANPAFKQ